MKELTVGDLRKQTALSSAKERVILVAKDHAVNIVLHRYRVVGCYPDTTDERGNFNGTFKIEVEEID